MRIFQAKLFLGLVCFVVGVIPSVFLLLDNTRLRKNLLRIEQESIRLDAEIAKQSSIAISNYHKKQASVEKQTSGYLERLARVEKPQLVDCGSREQNNSLLEPIETKGLQRVDGVPNEPTGVSGERNNDTSATLSNHRSQNNEDTVHAILADAFAELHKQQGNR